MGIYSIRELEFYYPEGDRKILENINIDISQGEFVVLIGQSGSGKTTLLRQLKPSLSPHGIKRGEIYFNKKSLKEIDQATESSEIGFVFQNPDNQIVTDKVWHELAFGLESLGYDTPTIRLRVAEMASYFGIQNWFYKDVRELSGGQKQLLNLAAIMSMQPSVLILDEPTSQLDPIAASDFLETLSKINRELGTTVILTEHRLEESMPLADRVLVMDNGKVIADGEPRKIAREIQKEGHKMSLAMPTPMRVYAAVENGDESPITVREGRAWLDKYSKEHNLNPIEDNIEEKTVEKEVAIKIDEAWFKYERELPDVVKGLSLKVYPGELFAILGGNGTGKTTTLSLISGINRPYRGKVYIKDNEICDIPNGERYGSLLGVLPQDPKTLFVKKTVELDLYEMFKSRKMSNEEKQRRVKRVVSLCDLSRVMEQHPYDLSGGEQQRVALAKVLLLEPSILLLDEPTKGMDAEFKKTFAGILKKLLRRDTTIIMVSHDVEFCAEYADRCALFFDGGIVTEDSPREFFSGNSFYTTTANRMARHKLKEAITADDIIKSCGGKVSFKLDDTLEGNDEILEEENKEEVQQIANESQKKNKIILKILSFLLLIFSITKIIPIIYTLGEAGLQGDFSEIGFSSDLDKLEYIRPMILFVFSCIVFNLAVFGKDKKEVNNNIQVEKEKRNLSKRTIMATISILLLIPLTIFIGVYYLEDRKYYFISLLIILETMIPFTMIFEGRKPQARELVIIAVLCSIGIAGRAAFFMLPQFKPVAAMVIISAVAFGGESGFLVGAITMLVSNMMYSQGPWTPWQMFAMGIIGFLSGILFRKGFLRRDRISLGVFGGIVVFFIYGGIMNPASVLMFQSNITWPMIFTSWLTGIPFDLIHSGATVFFILVIGEPMLEKLDRIKVKYGLIE